MKIPTLLMYLYTTIGNWIGKHGVRKGYRWGDKK